MNSRRQHTFNAGAITSVLLSCITLMSPAAAIAQNSLTVQDSSATDKFVVTDQGLVGIGTNAPTTSLSVKGSDTATTQIRINYIHPSAPTSGGLNAAGGYTTYFNYPNNGLPLANDRLGYYLFGAMDTDGTTVRNSAGIAGRAEQNWVTGLNGSTLVNPSYLVFETTDVTGGRTEKMRVSGTGNVGIGTASPYNRLTVFKAVGTNDYTYTAQHGMQFRILNGQGTLGSRAIEMGILDNGTGIIQANEAGVGYNTLALNPVAGTVSIRSTSPSTSYALYVNGSAYSTSGWLTPSDIKYKKDIGKIESPLDKIIQMTGHSYTWKADEYRDKEFPKGKHYGVIAQEIEAVLPEVVNTDAAGSKTVAYTEIIPVLIEAIKEQQKIINKLQAQLNAIKNR